MRREFKGGRIGEMLLEFGLIDESERDEILAYQQSELLSYRQANGQTSDVPHHLQFVQIAIARNYTTSDLVELINSLQAIDRLELAAEILGDHSLDLVALKVARQEHRLPFSLDNLNSEQWIMEAPSTTKLFQSVTSLFKLIIAAAELDPAVVLLSEVQLAREVIADVVTAGKQHILSELDEETLNEKARWLKGEVHNPEGLDLSDITEMCARFATAARATISLMKQNHTLCDQRYEEAAAWINLRTMHVASHTLLSNDILL